MRDQDYRNNGWSRMTLINEIPKIWEMTNLKFGGHIPKVGRTIPWRKITMSIRVNKLNNFSKNVKEEYGTGISKTKGWQKISVLSHRYNKTYEHNRSFFIQTEIHLFKIQPNCIDQYCYEILSQIFDIAQWKNAQKDTRSKRVKLP